jgi:hypothetical protein
MNTTDGPAAPQRQWLARALIVGAVTAAVVLLIAISLRRPAINAYAPDPRAPEEVGDRRIARTYTIDATNTDRWAAFDFSRGSAVPAGDPDGWDIAFRRFNVMTNGGEGFGGNAGVADLGVVAFDSVTEVPATGYIGSSVRSDSSNAAIERWYDYGFTSHILSPKANVYAVRTADGRFAKLQILSYYCPGATPGCVTFRYVYQGDGSRDVSSGPAGPEPGTSYP